MVKNLIFRVFNLTVGKVVRLFQKTLISQRHQGVFFFIEQQALRDSAEYALRNFSMAMRFDERTALWSFCLNRLPTLSAKEGIIAEFGVWKGDSINFFAKKCPDARVFGFDSFEGLKEDWYGTSGLKGHFSMKGQLPQVERNVSLVKGWFENTLPDFLKKLQQQKILLLHMDADTYESTYYVLHSVIKNLGEGSIIIFDEYFGYPNFQSHEFKAWKELVQARGIKYRYIAFTEMQVAIEIL